MACCCGLAKSSYEEHFMDAEVSVYRLQRQRHILEDIPKARGREKEDTLKAELTKREALQKDKLAEMLSTGAERFVGAVTGVCMLS